MLSLFLKPKPYLCVYTGYRHRKEFQRKEIQHACAIFVGFLKIYFYLCMYFYVHGTHMDVGAHGGCKRMSCRTRHHPHHKGVSLLNGGKAEASFPNLAAIATVAEQPEERVCSLWQHAKHVAKLGHKARCVTGREGVYSQEAGSGKDQAGFV